MEKISTPREALLPRVANLLTLAVVVMATWWSGAQRPSDQPALAAVETPAAGAVAAPQLKTFGQAAAVGTHSTSGTTSATANWLNEVTTVPLDGLQVVHYRARTQR